MDNIAIFTVHIGSFKLKDLYTHRSGIRRITVCNYNVHALDVKLEYHADPLQDCMVLRVPMRYVTVINEIGDEDANKD